MGRTRKLPAAQRLTCGFLALLAVGAAPAAGLLAANPGKMTRYEIQPDYTMVSVDNTDLVRHGMPLLPRFSQALEKSLGIDTKPTGIPTYLYVVADSIWDRYLEPSSGIPSEFVPTRFVNYMVANNTTINQTNLFHVHTHLFVYNQMPGVYPLWFDEGLAVMMSRVQLTDMRFRIYPPRHGDEGGWVPTARVLRATKSSPEYLSQGQLYSFHFQSHSMVYRALVDDAEFGKQVFKYLEAINNLATPDEAEAVLGNIDDLDFKMRSYVNKSGKKRVITAVEKAPPLLTLPKGTPMSTLESLLGIATICIEGGLHLDMVHELLDAADGETDGKVRTVPLRVRLAAKLRDDAKLEELYAALKQDSDPVLERAVGLALYDRSQSLDARADARRTDLETRAFELLNRSLDAEPDDPETIWAFAMVAADLKKDMDLALQRLLPLFERMPTNPDIAHAAGKVLYAKGETNLMPYLTAVQRYAHTIKQRRWAVEQINLLREEAAANQ